MCGSPVADEDGIRKLLVLVRGLGYDARNPKISHRTDEKKVSDGMFPVELIGAKIKRLRQEREIVQDQLAIEAGVDQSSLSMFERGVDQGLGPAPLARSAKVLGLTLEELTAGTDWSENRQRK
jgi:DNA-binding XRE family transcriptional regulator